MTDRHLVDAIFGASVVVILLAFWSMDLDQRQYIGIGAAAVLALAAWVHVRDR